MQEVANRYGYILCACDWQGMSTPDAPFIVKMLSEDLGRFYIIPDRLTQGVLNSVLLMKVVNEFTPACADAFACLYACRPSRAASSATRS